MTTQTETRKGNDMRIEETVDGRFMVLVNGFQWGPVGAKADRSGAYDTTFPTRAAARAAYRNRIK